MLQSKVIKYALMSYWRYKRQYVVGTEVNCADILADNGKESLEIEIKVTKNDLKNEIRNKKGKHDRYKDPMRESVYDYKGITTVPNKFWVCVVPDMVDFTLDFVNDLNLKYGIIVCSGPYNVRILKSAKKLHTIHNPIHQELIYRRNASELMTYYEKEMKEKGII